MRVLKMKFSRLLQEGSVASIRGYQCVRPYLDVLTRSVFGFVSECKHHPTCSEYAIEQIRLHGTIAGVRKGMTRILSCH